jgi:hypothetical protein
MRSGRKSGLRGHSIAAVFAALALTVTGVSSGTAIPSDGRTVGTGLVYKNGGTAGYAAYLSHQRRKGCKWCAWNGGGARALPVSLATTSPAFFQFASLTTAASGSSPNSVDSPADVDEILATDIAFLSDRNVTPVRFAGGVISRLESSMNWRSNAFSIAGSRVWSKVIKFSSTGVNVRLPLN